MLTRAEFRQLFGLPKRRTTSKKTTKSSKVGKKVSTKKPTKKTTTKTSMGKPKALKLGKRLIGGKARTVYKSRKTGAKYYKRTIKGITKRMYIGKPVQKKATRKTRFGYVNGGVPSSSALMGPFPMSMANGSVAVGEKAAFGKKKRKVVARKPVRKVVRKVRKTKVGTKVLAKRRKVTRKPVRKTRVGTKVLAKRRKVTRKPVRKTRVGAKVLSKRRKVTRKPVRKTRVGTKVLAKRRKVTRKPTLRSRFGLSHGRPSGLATGPYPF